MHSAMLNRGAETLQCKSAKEGWLSGYKEFYTLFHSIQWPCFLNILKSVLSDNLQSLLTPEIFVAAESTTKSTGTVKNWKFPFLELNLLIFCSYSMSLARYEVKKHDCVMYLF
jgi:hypothetical protein